MKKTVKFQKEEYYSAIFTAVITQIALNLAWGKVSTIRFSLTEEITVDLVHKYLRHFLFDSRTARSIKVNTYSTIDTYGSRNLEFEIIPRVCCANEIRVFVLNTVDKPIQVEEVNSYCYPFHRSAFATKQFTSKFVRPKQEYEKCCAKNLEESNWRKLPLSDAATWECPDCKRKYVYSVDEATGGQWVLKRKK